METFLAVAEEKSFSRAALRLHRTQPAVSQVTGKLEAELGESLFERQTGSLTDAGEVLREYAVKLVNLRDEAGSALKELRSLHRGRRQLLVMSLDPKIVAHPNSMPHWLTCA